jgi:hypothetical protein
MYALSRKFVFVSATEELTARSVQVARARRTTVGKVVFLNSRNPCFFTIISIILHTNLMRIMFPHMLYDEFYTCLCIVLIDLFHKILSVLIRRPETEHPLDIQVM